MAKFAWEAQTKAGELMKGEMEAPNEEAVIAKLRSQNLAPGKIKERGKGMDMEIKIPGLSGRVTGHDLVVFTRQFAVMIDAGLPLVQCLEILASDVENPAFRDVLTKVKQDVESGATFADALSQHPKAFDNLYVNLVAAGEVGGILDTILNRLAEYIEKSEALKKQIKGAMIYPIVVMTIAFTVVVVLLVFVIPTFKQMFEDLGGTLPALTQYVIDLSNWMKANFIYFPAVIPLYLVWKAIRKWPTGEYYTDFGFLKLPVFGNLIQKTAVARFTRTLGTMVSSGVPIMDALEICSRTAGNRVVELEILDVRQAISEGKTLAEPLQGSRVFPPMVVQMISVGEQTGAMDTMLTKIADFYDMEVDNAVSALTSLMEPLLIVFLGVTVGTIAIAMYLPIFNIADVI